MRTFISILYVFLVGIGTLTPCAAQIPNAADVVAGNDTVFLRQPEPNRPRIGLCFAGGGAKGAAHIGVLKVIEEVGIPIDYVTGTSMGAIIGGLYSLGYNAHQMDTIISQMDWSVYMSDKMDRRGMSSVEKEDASAYLINVPFNVGNFKKQLSEINEGTKEKINISKQQKSESDRKDKMFFLKSLPGGFIEGSNLLNLFNCLSVGYQDSMDFNDLPIPYACIGADVISQKEVVLRSGRLPDAMRGSMAIPGVFAPMPYNDMLLVDGGMFNNFPVKVCQDMGADIVIGIEVSKDKKVDPSEIQSLPELLGRLFDMVTRGSLKENRQQCTIYIRPDVEGYGSLSFDPESIRTLIQRGYNAGDAKRDILMALRRELDKMGAPAHTEYKGAPAKNVSPHSSLKVAISDVKINGVDEWDRKWLMRKSGLDKMSEADGKEIDRAVSICYGTGYFKKILYLLKPMDDGTYQLVINTVMSPPHVMSLGLRFDSQDVASILLRVGWNTYKISGFKADFSTRLCVDPWFNLTIGYKPRRIPVINLALETGRTNMSILRRGEPLFSTEYWNSNAELFFSQYYSRTIRTAIGVKLENYKHINLMSANNMSLEDAKLENFNSTTFGPFFRFDFDNLDDHSFPTRGLNIDVTGDWKMLNSQFSKRDMFSDDIFSLKAGMEFDIPCGPFLTLIPQVYGRVFIAPEVSDNDLGHIFSLVPMGNYYGNAYIGRYISQQLPFIGSNKHQYTASDILTILRADLRWHIQGKHYLTGMVNYERDGDFDQYLKYAEGRGIYGAGVRYSFNSIMGPLSFQVHWSNVDRTTSFFKQLGVFFNWGYEF